MADRNGKLAALMDESGFSHKALARAVVTAGTRAGKEIACDHTYVSRWLKGSIPRGDLPRYVAEALSRKVGRSLTLDDIGMGAASTAAVRADVGLDFPDRPDDAANTVADLWRADLAESELLTMSKPDPVAWHETSVRFLVAPADAHLSRSGTRAVGMADVEMLRSTADMFARLDGQFGGGHARRSLIQYLHSDVRPLLNGQYSEEVGRYLHNAVAEALLIAGWMSYDSGIHGIAQRYFIQALRMAQAAGDRLLGSSILSAMSHQATFVGNYREAATLARAASMGPAAGLTPTLAAQFRAMEARALARMGDARGCDLALAEAERQLSLRTPDSDPPWIAYFDEVELAAEFGHCFRDLGRSAEATERGAGSIVGDGFNNRSDFFATMVQAEAYVNQGEIGQGFGIALEALRLGEGLKSARCVQYVRDFQERLTFEMRKSTEFLEFEEQAHSFRLWQQL